MAAVDFLFNLVSDLDLQVVLLLETAPGASSGSADAGMVWSIRAMGWSRR